MSNYSQYTDYRPTTLADKAVLVRLKVSRQRRSVQDKNITAQIQQQLGQDRDLGYFNKKLFAKSQRFAEMNTAINNVIKYHSTHTTPWMDEGVRALPTALYSDYTDTLRRLMDEAKDKIADFTDNYADEVYMDMARLKTSANMDDYAGVPEIGFDVRFMPLPTNDDWRVEVTEADKQLLDRAMRDATDGVTQDLFKRVLTPVSALVEKLQDYTGEKNQRFSDNLVTNITDVLDLLDALNINNDPRVTQLKQAVTQATTTITPAALRNSQLARDSAKQQLAGILTAFN